jgi:hypothetical protein
MILRFYNSSLLSEFILYILYHVKKNIFDNLDHNTCFLWKDYGEYKKQTVILK